jgi:high-affinity iron transporter
MNSFIIAFRECLESALIVGIIYTLLVKKDLNSYLKSLWWGVGMAVLASIAVAIGLDKVTRLIQNESYIKLSEGIFMLITAGFLLYVIFWLSRNVSSREDLENKTRDATKSKYGTGIFILVFFAILREGFETAMFLFANIRMGTFSISGFTIGIILAIGIGYMIVAQGKKINLKPFFSVSTFFLVLFAAGMVAYGTHEIEEFVVKGGHLEKLGMENKSEIGRVWNVFKPNNELLEGQSEVFYSFNEKKGVYIHILHDKGSIGQFLKGFFGYNSDPNWPEFILWLITLGIGLNMWKKFYTT